MEDNRKDKIALHKFSEDHYGVDIYENGKHVSSVYHYMGNVFEYNRTKKCG